MPTTLRHFQRPRSRAYLLGLALLAVLSARAQPTSWNWSRAADTGSNELILDVAVDPATGDLYAVGTYEASGAFSLPDPTGSSDGFLAKFDTNGNLQWSVSIGGTGEDKAYGVAVDPGGRVYVTGCFESIISATLASTPQTIISLGGSDMFLTCFNANGQHQWMERGGGNGDDVGYSVVTNTSGVFVHGVFKGNTTFGSSTHSQLNSWNEQMFVARYPLTGGSPTWVISGGGDGQELAERMAVDTGSIYVTGRFEGNYFTWRSATGGALSSVSAINNEKNGYVARISNTGNVQWTRVIDTPNGPEPEFNAIATDGTKCYLGGRAPAGTVFPGLTATTAFTVQDDLFIAALDISNGNGLWLRTAQGTNSEQTEVFDIATGPSGQIYLSGAYDLNMTWDDGSMHTGSYERELFVCRMTTTGQLLWLMKESATGNELPLAIAVGPVNKVVVGGTHTEQLRLTPLIYSHGSSTNAFLGAFTDPVQASITPSAAQWKLFGPMCSSDAILDLNSRLRGYADNWVGSPIDVTSPSSALGLPDGSGALYTQPGANAMLDLGDTAAAGANLTLRLRSQTSGMPSRLEIAFSIDGNNWSLFIGNPQVNSNTWTDLSITSPVPCRFVRIRLSSTAPNSPFLLDGVTFLNETQMGGTWAGPGVNAAGTFNPNGLAGWQTITYTVMVNSNPVAQARTVWVGPEPGAVITGASGICPGSTGTLLNLTLTSPLTSVTGWGTSPDGVNWSIVPGNALSFTTGPINGTLRVMARVFSVGCGTRNTPVHQVSAMDAVPPVILNCPTAMVLGTDPGSCFRQYTLPIIHSTDNCDLDTESNHTVFWLPANQSVWMEVTGSTVVDLVPGIHTMRETHQDDSGNNTTCTWNVTVVDNEAPTISCPINATPMNVGASCTVALPNYTESAGVSDNCISNGGLVRTQVPAPGTQLAPGSHTVTLTATQNGQSATCSFFVTVVDDTPPTIVGCPATTMTVNVPATSCSAVVTWDPPSLANTCSGAVINQTSGPASGSVFPIGQTIITYAATDANGNIATCSFIVEVKDATGPTITCNQDIAIEATAGLCGAVVTYPVPTASDNCGTVTVTRIAGPASGSVFPVGTTVVRHRASDNAVPPNTTDCFFWVTVLDATAPSFTTCSDITANASPTSCAAVVNYALPNVNEPCTTCSNGSIPAGYAALGTYLGRTYYYQTTNSTWQEANNAAIAAGGHLVVIRDAAHNDWLRSAVNAAGGTNQSFWIALNDVATEGNWRWTNNAPVSFLNWDTNEPTSNGGNEDYVYIKPNGQWNDEMNTTSMRSVIEVETSCIAPLLTSGISTGPGATFPLGTTTVSYASTDAAGNTATCSFNVLITDITPPTIICPSDIVVNVNLGSCTAVVNYAPPVAADNCSGTTTLLIAGPASESTFPLGTTTVTYRTTDAAGLISTCSFSITVIDNTACGCANPVAGSVCDDGNENTVNDIIGADCTCAGQPMDCAGVQYGTAFLDNCGTCVGGNTGNTACTQDCSGVWGGSALPGTACDDGSANTINDTWNSGCQCAGTPVIIDCTSNAGGDQTICGLTTTLTAVGAGSWSGPPSITFTSITSPESVIIASQPGTFELFWTVSEGTCVNVDTVVVTFNAQADASFAYAQSTYCMGDPPPAPWMAQLGGTFSAQSTGLVIDPSTGIILVGESAPGDHIITYSISGPCPNASSQQVSIAQNPDASWTTPAPICGDATPIDLNSLITGTTGGSWSGAGVTGSTFTPAGLIGSNNITYTASIGECSSYVTQALVVAAPVVADAGPDVTVCGPIAVMNATNGKESGGWSATTGNILIEPVISPNATVTAGTFGTYALVWTVSNGVCMAIDTVLVDFIEPITGLWVNAGPDQDLAVVDQTTLHGSASSGSNPSWLVLSGSGVIIDAHDSSTMITGLSVGDNLVVLTATIDQCSSVSDTVSIHVDDLFIPEGFSPNGDDVNDKWEIRGIEAYPMSSLQIFNRWGHLVYRSDSYRNEWNGKGRNAGELPDDTYFYVLNLGGELTYNGHIILKR